MYTIRINAPPDIFTLNEISGSGQYIVRGNKAYAFEVFTDGGRASTFIYKIGYSANSVYNIISMSDGLVFKIGDKQALIDYLNHNSNNSKFRWATEEEVILVIKSQSNSRVKGSHIFNLKHLSNLKL